MFSTYWAEVIHFVIQYHSIFELKGPDGDMTKSRCTWVLQTLVQVSTSTQICAVMITYIGAGIGAVLGTQRRDAELQNPGNRAKS